MKQTIGTYTLIKNEARWIGPHILSVLPHVDEMVFFDGNSTDGTLDIIAGIRDSCSDGPKIRLFENKDPKDLRDDYVRLFNDCMWTLNTDWAWFLHPDMFVYDIGKLKKSLLTSAPAMATDMESVAGDPNGKMYHIASGRGSAWKNIYRLRNPNLGAHYHGYYGAADEDTFFSELTGHSYNHYGSNFDLYPYQVHESGVKALHFSDVRDYNRRYGRMRTCLLNQGFNTHDAERIAESHPRVTLKDGHGFVFIPVAESVISKQVSMFMDLSGQLEKQEIK